MDVSLWLWLTTIVGLLALLTLDLVLVDRKPHSVGPGEAAKWVGCYVGLAAVFGAGVWYFGGHAPGVEFFTGYITEYSLSVDNLFIFMVIVSSFRVPVVHQHRVLLIGIVLALVLRGAFIAVGAALITRFVWVFFIFGAVLVWTAISLLRGNGGRDEEYHENALTRRVRRIAPVTEDYVGHRLVINRAGKRWVTPMLLVIVAIGSTDLMFAFDSIPAIFGITQDAYLVFAANAFALMGLRQLYFLLGGLVKKLTYLPYGLAAILAFIGVKLVLHALREYRVTPEWLEISSWLSLAVIGGVLLLTTAASMISSWRAPGTKAGQELVLDAAAPEDRERHEGGSSDDAGQ